MEKIHSKSNTSKLRIDGRYERFTWDESYCDVHPPPQERLDVVAGLEHEWLPAPQVALVPAARAEVLHSSSGGGAVDCSGNTLNEESFDDLWVSPSLGARWLAWPGLTLRANFGRYSRAPDLTELFGNRGITVGNPDLKRETSINADLGAAYSIKKLGALSSLRLEAAGFGSWVNDLIAYLQNSQNTFRPENLDSAEILGIESSLRLLFFDSLSLQGNYTYQRAVNTSNTRYLQGRHLPGLLLTRPTAKSKRARSSASGAPDSGWRRITQVKTTSARPTSATPCRDVCWDWAGAPNG